MVHLFHHAQLLRGIANRMFMTYTCLSQKFIQIGPPIFATLIVTENADVLAGQIFHPSLVFMKCSKDVRLLGDEINSWKLRKIVDEGDPIHMATTAMHGQWPMHI